MGVGAGIDDDGGILLARRLDQVDQHAFMVALGELERDPQALGFGPARLLDVGQGIAAVNLRLPLAQHVEIGPVEHQHRLVCRPTPGGLRGQIVPPRPKSAGRYSMAIPRHKAGSARPPELPGMGKQAIRQCIEAASFFARQRLIEPCLVIERQRHDARMHGAAAAR